MKAFVATILICVCGSVSAKDIVAVGHGSTMSRALQDAKREATDRVAGVFIIGQTDVEGDNVKERINQYSGGFVRSYEVLSTTTKDGVVEVVIKADVDEDKINTVILSKGGEIPASAITSLKNARTSFEELEDAIQVIMSDRNKVHVDIKSVKYDVSGLNTIVTVDYDVAWSPKWYSDLQALAKTSGTEVGYFSHKDYGLCFNGDRKLLLVTIECYDIHYNLDLPVDIAFELVAHNNAGARAIIDRTFFRSSALYYLAVYRSSGAALSIYKNGVLHGTATVQMETKALESVSGFTVESSLNNAKTGYSSVIDGSAGGLIKQKRLR